MKAALSLAALLALGFAPDGAAQPEDASRRDPSEAPAPAPPPPVLRTAGARLAAVGGPRTSGQATLAEQEGAVSLRVVAWSMARPAERKVSLLSAGRCVRGMPLPAQHQELGAIRFDSMGRASFDTKLPGATLRGGSDSLLGRRLVIHDQRVLSCGPILASAPQPTSPR